MLEFCDLNAPPFEKLGKQDKKRPARPSNLNLLRIPNPPARISSFLLSSLLICLLSGLLAFAATAQESIVKTALLRLRLELAQNSPWPAAVGQVEVSPDPNFPGSFGVFTDAGKPVAVQTFWAAPGELTRLRFDTSGGAKTYYLCFGTNLPAPPLGWTPDAGLVVESRSCTAQPVQTPAQVAQLLSTAGPIQGRSYVPQIFLGMNPFGPSSYYAVSFSGWLRIADPGNYRFATVSAGPSWLKLDGKPVVEWLGEHGPHGGRHGEHHGELQLRAGVHHLEYSQIQFDGEAAAETAWQPPTANRYEVIPAGAFVPVATFRTASFESAPASESLYLDWRTAGHCALDDAQFIRVHFRLLDSKPGREYRWRFDDGTEARGLNLDHYFPQPGFRSLTVQAWEASQRVATKMVRVRVAPNWMQREGWRDDLFEEAKKEFLGRALDQTPPRDLAAMVLLADRATDRELESQAGTAMIRHAAELNTPVDGVLFYKLAQNFAHQGDAGDALAEKAYRLALTPERTAPATAEKARLKLAELLIQTGGNLDEAEKLLAALVPGKLTGDETRLQKLLRGDLDLARGRVEEAAKKYAALGGPADWKAAGAALTARLESASILVEHGDFEAAQTALDRLTVEIPAERMSLGTGLLKIKLALARKEFQRAYAHSHRLLPVAENEPRQSEILYNLIESSQALGKAEESRRALSQLLKDFPYSESAAKAKARQR